MTTPHVPTRDFPGVASAQGEMNRRTVLRSAAGLAALSLIPDSLTARELRQDTMKDAWIDAHSHIWTRDVARFPLATGQTVADLSPPSFTAEECLELVEREGVGRVVLIQHHIYHGWDNSYLIDAAARFPNRFRVVGMVDDTSPHPDLTMRKLLEKKVTALRITSLIRGPEKWLTGPGMTALWKMAAQTRQAMCCLINPGDLPGVDRMCAEHPETPVVIDHFARIGVDGEVREQDLKNLCALARHKHTYVKVSAYYALGKKEPPYRDLIPMIRRLYDVFGPQRLMWASDSPYQLVGPHTYRDSIALIREGCEFLSDEDRQWLLRKTAEKVYFL